MARDAGKFPVGAKVWMRVLRLAEGRAVGLCRKQEVEGIQRVPSRILVARMKKSKTAPTKPVDAAPGFAMRNKNGIGVGRRVTKSCAYEKFLLLGWKSARTFASAGRFFAART
jgi:hypothetical protein